MAKFLSQLVTVARGSVGGLTFTANQFSGLIMRARTSPVNPQTSVQSFIRVAMSSASNQWNLLTDAERAAWEAYADTLVFEGPLGSYSVPGRQVMVGNIAAVLYGNNYLGTPLVPTYTAPTVPGFASWSILKLDAPATGTGIRVVFSNDTGEDMHALIERSIAFGPSRQRFKGPFLSSTAQFVPVPDGVSTYYDYDDLGLGQVYFIRVRGITTEAAHRLTSQQVLRGVAVAAP